MNRVLSERVPQGERRSEEVGLAWARGCRKGRQGDPQGKERREGPPSSQETQGRRHLGALGLAHDLSHGHLPSLVRTEVSGSSSHGLLNP